LGALIYDYPLGLQNGYFKEINLIRINEIDDSKADEEIQNVFHSKHCPRPCSNGSCIQKALLNCSESYNYPLTKREIGNGKIPGNELLFGGYGKGLVKS
jgi:hypothetical protein